MGGWNASREPCILRTRCSAPGAGDGGDGGDDGSDGGAGRDWGQEEKGMTEDEMAGWHH